MTFRQWYRRHEDTIDDVVYCCIGVMALLWIAFMLIWVTT